LVTSNSQSHEVDEEIIVMKAQVKKILLLGVQITVNVR
jgi:hypothetical protein